MSTHGIHARYDLTDLAAGIARTGRRDQLIDRIVGSSLLLITGAGIGFLTGVAVVWPW